jgi:tRNA dimethylallyltransferase
MKTRVIAVVGPTASGKTALAVELAKRLNGEIVSADSMQIYKGMNIATAKPTKEEMQGIEHHMLDFLDVTTRYSVAEYVRAAHKCIEQIAGKGKLPIVCGGTGLYIDSLLKNIDFGSDDEDIEKRDEIRRVCKDYTGEELLKMLASFDPETAEKLHPNNRGRIIRAIEVYTLTGITQSEAVRRSKLKESPYDVTYIGLDCEKRAYLYKRIDKRVDDMMENGLFAEAREYINLYDNSTAAQAIGYKELAPAILDKMSVEMALDSLKQATRRYAKRQLTWFRKNKEINWLCPEKYQSIDELADEAVKIIKAGNKNEK